MQKKSIFYFPAIILLLSSFIYLNSQLQEEPEVIQRKGYTLKIINQDANFNPALKERMVETFFYIYPTLAKNFNRNSTNEVTFFIDTTYTGVAEAGGGRVRYNPKWFVRQPGDIDVVTHEVMHIVQNYPNGAGPWWVTEGIADYVRYTFGVDNEGAGWTLTEFNNNQKYDNGYRITARFFVWIESKVKPGVVKALDHAMRTNTYTKDIWKEETGKTVDELWEMYAQDPSI
ncbi:MAG: secretory protein [Thalassobius sp.]|nr:secretory protein [Thalassovita sp.]